VNGFDAADAEFAGEVDVMSAEGASIGRQAASGAQQQQQQQRQQRIWRSKL
jgi:hypothetical protein